MDMKPLVPRHGNWVDGDTFFGRGRELDQLDRLVSGGNHVLLTGQRRTGKTSLLREFTRRNRDRYEIVFVDLEDGRTAEDAVVGLALGAAEQTRLWTKVRAGWESVLGSLDQVGGDSLAIRLRDGLGADWRARGDRVFADLAAHDRPVVVMIDELAFLISRLLRDESRRVRPDGPVRVEDFLSWLRKNALRHVGRLRLILTGSIGIEPLASRAGASGALAYLTPMLLEPWSAEEAVGCLHALSLHEQVSMAPEAAEAVVERLGSCIPYHVQLVHQHVVEDARRLRRTQVTAADVERVYTTRVLGMHGHMELAHMEERLSRILSPEETVLALELLTEAAVGGHLPPAAARILAGREGGLTLLRSVLDVLEHDGYLRRDPDGWRFASRLLKDWWRRRFGEFYVQALDRVV